MKIGICGMGFVGKACHNSLPREHFVEIYDPKMAEYNCFDRILDSDAMFICVPTPTKAGKQDTDILFNTLRRLEFAHYEGLVIIKSTTLPRIVKDAITLFKLNLMVAPEFLDQATYLKPCTKHLIGVQDMFQARRYQDIFEDCFDLQQYYITNPITAAAIKYCHNIHGAMKVAFFNEMFEVCETEGIDYREMLGHLLKINDNVGAQYTRIAADGSRGFGGECFIKDSIAFSNCYDSKIINAVLESNFVYREEEMIKHGYVKDMQEV